MNKNNKKLVLSLIALFGLILSLYLLFQLPKYFKSNSDLNEAFYISADNKVSPIFLSDSVAERRQGLSGKESFGGRAGMLFVFSDLGYHGIWMKNMHMPIDIIWLDADFNIISLEEDVSPESYPDVFYPKNLSKYVFEVPSGTISKNNFRLGDKLHFSF